MHNYSPSGAEQPFPLNLSVSSVFRHVSSSMSSVRCQKNVCQWVCVKCRSVGSNMCKMRETVRGISRILHMVNNDPLNGVLGEKV